MDKIALVKREVKEAEWVEKVRECQGSGISASQWCRENGVSLKTYYYHLHKVREKLCEQIPVEVGAYHAGTSGNITVRDSSGISIEITDGTSAETIEAVIRALKC